jgi:DNA-binding transcriptional regulator LsrR (DeoR family)
MNGSAKGRPMSRLASHAPPGTAPNFRCIRICGTWDRMSGTMWMALTNQMTTFVSPEGFILETTALVDPSGPRD